MGIIPREELTATMTWWRASHEHPLLTAEQERALGERVQAGDVEARNDLVCHNIRLAISVARQPRYHGRGLGLDDLVQLAVMGLITAADKFDPARGLKFSTYATYWVRQSIDRGITNHGGAVRLPAHMETRLSRIAREAAAYAALHGEEPDEATLAALAECSVEQVRRAREAATMQRLASLDAARDVGESGKVRGDDLSLVDSLADPAADPARDAEHGEVAARLSAALDRLPPRHREIVAAHWGIGGRPRETLEQIGQRVGLTRERVRQIEREALAHLRDRAELRELLAA